MFSFVLKFANVMTRPLQGSKSYTTVFKDMTEPLVTVRQGKLKGAQQRLLDGSPYYSFKGIPYAQVPKRFAAPIHTEPWEGVYDATKHGAKCPQYDFTARNKESKNENENCLFLNVYTKSLNPDAKIPVMFFIHGGAFRHGSGNSDEGLGPEFLLQHDVILVTINYRLEMFGFLCLDTPEVPGNAGIKDQVAALRWVKDNIEKFGGDSDNITIFGESAGASSVTYLMQSPMSKGLFSKAISQSGVSVADWSQGKDGKERAFRAGKCLGKDTTDTTELLEFLRSVPANKLPKMTLETMTKDEEYRGLPIHFAPVVEKQFDNVEASLTEEPVDALLSGQLCKVPLIIGYNSDEYLFLLSAKLKKIDFVNKNLKYLVPREIALRVTEEKQKEMGERIRNFYIGNRDFTKEDAKAICDMYSDIHFIHSAHRFANFYSKTSPTFLYKFSCDTELNVVKKNTGLGHMKGACHVDELFYLFYSPNPKYKRHYENPKLMEMIYRMTKLWTDFAKTGNPTPDDSLGVTWLPLSRSHAYLHIDEQLTTDRGADSARMSFWNKLYAEVGLPVERTSHL